MLVSAAIDYDIINGNHYGALAGRVADDIKKKRREALGLEPTQDEILGQYGSLSGDRSPAAKARRELDGGIVVIGRHSFKEYMAGLKRGWSESLAKKDEEEELAMTLSDDVFEESEIHSTVSDVQQDTVSSSPLLPPSQLTSGPGSSYSLFGKIRQPPPSKNSSLLLSDTPPATIPPQPPIGFVPFTNHLGWRQIPYMIYDFFTERHRVLSGCEAGYAIVMASSRPMKTTDLDVDIHSEKYIKGAWQDLPKRIEKAKEEYYKELKQKIKVARELAYGEREPTRAEKTHPPMTEVELRAQRLKKELKWKEDLEGWEILNGPVSWDERFEGKLHIFNRPLES